MADQTTVTTSAEEVAMAAKRKKIIKYVLIAVIGGLVLWFVYKKFIK